MLYRARYRRIILFFARVVSSITLWDIVFPKIGLKKWSLRTRKKRYRRYASSYRKLAIRMGGVLIKVGQFLSSRVDVLPQEVTSELAGLQDEVPAVPFEAIRKVAEAEYGVPLKEKFAEFDPTPLAAASLGQVHRAKLAASPAVASGDMHNANGIMAQDGFLNVVVKIQRPDIENIIATDLRALRTVGSWLNRYKPIRKRANVPGLLKEFSRILYEEIDYLAEGRNAEVFAVNFSGSPGVRVPKVVW